MLELRGVQVSYGPVEAVRGIDLDVSGAEVVALVGPNGAGKTSTLRAISGFVPHSGSIRFDGVDIR
jgi:branched-chain amino acid transport system ATP-binding protein